ncbi:hypothetical protein [Sporosarcina sp. FSL K6-3508]|uniref:hypothetical protein n=1 Tax=Sporosarcina sp. FSL K6-3508 TaxID=2921557 RepID=UPI0031599B19
MKQKWEQHGLKFIAFAAFIFLIIVNYGNWQEHQEFMEEASQHPTEKQIFRKYVVLDLLQGPHFSVQLAALPESSVPTKYNSSIIRIDQELFEQEEVGDNIAGYSADGKFYTGEMLKEEERWFYLLLTFFSLYPVGYLVYWLMKINTIQQFVRQIGKQSFINKTGNLLFSFIFFGIVGIILLFSLTEWKNVWENGYEKFFGTHHAETTALIIDRDVDWNSSLHGDHEYYLSLMYKPDNQDSIFIAKGVTWHTYHKYQEEMPIIYNTENPYQVFAKEIDPQDIFFILAADTVTIITVSLILVILLSILLYLLWKRRQKRKLIVKSKK